MVTWPFNMKTRLREKALNHVHAFSQNGISKLLWQDLIFYHFKNGGSKWSYDHSEHKKIYRKVKDKYTDPFSPGDNAGSSTDL